MPRQPYRPVMRTSEQDVHMCILVGSRSRRLWPWLLFFRKPIFQQLEVCVVPWPQVLSSTGKFGEKPNGETVRRPSKESQGRHGSEEAKWRTASSEVASGGWLSRSLVARLRFSRAEAADRCTCLRTGRQSPLSMGYQSTRSYIWILWINHEKVSPSFSVLLL